MLCLVTNLKAVFRFRFPSHMAFIVDSSCVSLVVFSCPFPGFSIMLEAH
uniref:Uncharacterized protein n=1 Tax=Anguilla anguilla TaxID=7936 RepID=A0A0E9TT96_ANGAN